MSETLIPPDLNQCQTEIRSYQPFIMGGNVNQVTRCKAKPVWIATETKRTEPGPLGSMSLCSSCKNILVMQFMTLKKPLPLFTKIPKKRKKPGGARGRNSKEDR